LFGNATKDLVSMELLHKQVDLEMRTAVNTPLHFRVKDECSDKP
jgi:hypothetical protein